MCVCVGRGCGEVILTVAAPLTCTDLLAVDRVPGTRSTDSCASFGFTSTGFTSLKQNKVGYVILNQNVGGKEDGETPVYSGNKSGNKSRQK